MVFGWAACLTIIYTSCALAWIPEPYILQVEHHCGDDAVTDAYATVVSDLEVKAKAVCAGGDVPFTNIDSANLRLPVSYPGQGSSPCIFKQRTGSRVYVITVVVSFGDPDNPVHEREEEYTLTCTFDDKGTDISSLQSLSDRLIAPVELQQHAGDPATGTSLHLTLTDILGEDFLDILAIGRLVQLKASSTGEASEVGVRPTACDAIATSDSNATKYAILRAGCGDGLVFPKNEGFEIDGLVARSPFFEGFSLAGSTILKFECNFTLCMSDCNGNTCSHTDRRRRSVNSNEGSARSERLPSFKIESQTVSVYTERRRRSTTQKLLDELLKSKTFLSDVH